MKILSWSWNQLNQVLEILSNAEASLKYFLKLVRDNNWYSVPSNT